MESSVTEELESTLPLSEVKRHDVIALPREIMVKAKAAAQTFGAIRALAGRTGETFASVGVIAERACLPPATVKRHLESLVKKKLLKRKARHKRRTPTFRIDVWFLSANDKAKFAMLPRWAATMLPTWAERAVFALVVSRDCLIEMIRRDQAAADDDVHGRLQYSAATLAKDSGLSVRAIGLAKEKLVRGGLLKIEPAKFDQDEQGRIRTAADTLTLNPDFPVPNDLLDCGGNRSAKVSRREPSDSQSDTKNRSAKVSQTQRKSEPDPAQIWARPSAKMSFAVNGSLEGTSDPPPDGTAAAAAGLVVEGDFRNTEKSNGSEYRHVDQEERRRTFAEQIRRMLANDQAAAGAVG